MWTLGRREGISNVLRHSRDRRAGAEEKGAGGRSQGQTGTRRARSRRASEATLLTSAFSPNGMKALSRGLT